MARADVLVQSFESGGFDFDGDTGSGVVYTPNQTIGATDGSFSLRVQSPQSWWINFGFLQLNPADVAANTILQFDVTTSTGVNFVPVFHNDPNLPTEPGSGGWNQGPGIFISAGPSTQTFTFDYADYDFDAETAGVQPLQPATTIYTLQVQGSTGNDIDFYIDNVRLTGAIPTLDTANAQWKLNGSGAWVNADNWESDPAGAIPGAIGSVVTFGTHGGSITTTDQIVVNVSQAVTVGQMNFEKGDGGYRIAGTFPVNVTGSINVNTGSHVISAPVNASNGAIFNVGDGNTLTIDNLGGGGFGLFEKSGDGTLIADKIQNVTLDLLGGTVELKPGNIQNNGWIYGLNVFNGSTFKMNGAQLRANSVSSNETPGTIDLGTGGVLNLGIHDAANYFGTITGAGNIIVGAILAEDEAAPVQVVVLGGVNSYTGTTTVTHGNTLQISSGENLGDGSPTNYLILDQGILQATGSFNMSRKVSIGAGGGTIDTNAFDVGVGVIDPGPFTKAGAGVLTATRLENLPSATVAAGTLRIAAGGGTVGTSRVSALSIADGAVVDLTDHSLVIDYETSPGSLVDDTRQNLASGKLTTSSGTAATRLGYGDNALLGQTSFGGLAVDSTSVLIKFTYAGDADLNGQVDVADLGKLASSWQTSGPWTSGDFDYSGFVDVADLGLLASNWQAGVGSPLGPSFQEALASVGLGNVAVPEPAAMGLLGTLVAWSLKRPGRRARPRA